MPKGKPNGAMRRRKGMRGQSEFKNMLLDRDWQVDDLRGGLRNEDMIAESPEGIRYSVEVKNHVIINMRAMLAQAREQARVRKLPWMLAVRIPMFDSDWIVVKKDERPVIWRGKEKAT